MHFFLADDKWMLDIKVGDIKRVKTLVGVDLLQPLPMNKPISNEFKTWLASGGFKLEDLTTKQELFLRAIYSDTDPTEASLIGQLQTDMLLLVDVIYALVKPQADARGLSDEQFGINVGGEELSQIVDAFWGAYEDFFRQSGNRPLEKMISINRRMVKKAMSTAAEAVDEAALEQEMDKLIAGAVSEMQSEDDEKQTHGERSTSAPDTLG